MRAEKETPLCRIRLDRVQFDAELPDTGLPEIPNFKTEWDRFVRPQTSIATYRRVRAYRSRRTGTKVYIQHERVAPWLRPAKATLIADDRRGLYRREVEPIVRLFPHYRFLLIEVAVDFSRKYGIDAEFIKKHAKFGRSRPCPAHPGSLRYGSRRSDKLVRAYPKPELEAFRVELQLNSSWLRRHRVQGLYDIQRLPELLYPAHFDIELVLPFPVLINRQILQALGRWVVPWR